MTKMQWMRSVAAFCLFLQFIVPINNVYPAVKVVAGIIMVWMIGWHWQLFLKLSACVVLFCLISWIFMLPLWLNVIIFILLLVGLLKFSKQTLIILVCIMLCWGIFWHFRHTVALIAVCVLAAVIWYIVTGHKSNKPGTKPDAKRSYKDRMAKYNTNDF